MIERAATSENEDRRKAALLIFGVFVIAASGLAYELIAGASASYLLGDSVTQFSLVIGLFMTAMGVGAWMSRHIVDPARGFCVAQIVLGVVGGLSAPLFYFAWLHTEPFEVSLFAVVFIAGALSGLEIPLIIRVLERFNVTPHTVSTVLTVDYAGALTAAIAFPLIITPYFGLIAASLIFGLLNLGVAYLAISVLAPEDAPRLRLVALSSFAALALCLVFSERALSVAEAHLYEDDVVYSATTPYQRVVVTNYRDRTRLFLNGAIQFDSRDEHRYHEALVHPALTRAERLQSVLILGGGDGMAAREALKYPSVAHVTLVDLDAAVTALFREAKLSALNNGALRDPRLDVVNADAWTWVHETERRFDAIIIDLPDPKSVALSKLYTRAFYTRVADLLNAGGALAVQSGAPFYARDAFWSVVETLGAARDPFGKPGARLATQPYAVWVPSFGLWGFTLAGPAAKASPRRSPPPGLKMFTPEQWAPMTHFSADLSRIDAPVNSLRNHVLPRLYEAGWRDSI